MKDSIAITTLPGELDELGMPPFATSYKAFLYYRTCILRVFLLDVCVACSVKIIYNRVEHIEFGLRSSKWCHQSESVTRITNKVDPCVP